MPRSLRGGDDRGGRRPARDFFAQPFIAKLLVRALLRQAIERERGLGRDHVEPDEREEGRDGHERDTNHQQPGAEPAASYIRRDAEMIAGWIGLGRSRPRPR